ncbi:MAG: deoxyribonuclease IV [Gemmatimonadales bacterium]
MPASSKPSSPAAADLLGAHVSSAGGAQLTPERARAIGATAIQLFTKSPNQWKEPRIGADQAAAFRQARHAAGIGAVVVHDSYLINLASPDSAMRTRSVQSFIAELTRCTALGVDGLVSHPGNFLDDRDRGLARNAAAYSRCLRAVPGPVMLLIEGTAGTGTVLGSSFEELRRLRDLIDPEVRPRVAFCADTCHLYSAGYDLKGDYEGVWAAWDRIIGLDLLRCLHLNDSLTPLGSRRDRHAWIGKGTLGVEPFRRIMTDPRFARIPKILEPPGTDRPEAATKRMLGQLRRYAAATIPATAIRRKSPGRTGPARRARSG